MVEQLILLDEQLEACGELVGAGSVNAIAGLSEMLGQAVQVQSLNPRRVPAGDLVDIIGARESVSVGVYLAVSGSGSGHMFLTFPPETAMELIDMVMGEPPGTTLQLDEMEESVMAEMGNIMGSFFLTALADATGLSLSPSPPAVMMDMAGSILDVALISILEESDDALVVETKFGAAGRAINSTLLVLPSPKLMNLLINHLINDAEAE